MLIDEFWGCNITQPVSSQSLARYERDEFSIFTFSQSNIRYSRYRDILVRTLLTVQSNSSPLLIVFHFYASFGYYTVFKSFFWYFFLLVYVAIFRRFLRPIHYFQIKIVRWVYIYIDSSLYSRSNSNHHTECKITDEYNFFVIHCHRYTVVIRFVVLEVVHQRRYITYQKVKKSERTINYFLTFIFFFNITLPNFTNGLLF